MRGSVLRAVHTSVHDFVGAGRTHAPCQSTIIVSGHTLTSLHAELPPSVRQIWEVRPSIFVTANFAADYWNEVQIFS